MKRLWLSLAATFATTVVCAQGTTTFNYHGQLSDHGLPASGTYDLTFTIFDAAFNGAPVGLNRTNLATVVTNGQFDVALDFGSSVFTGPARWVEVGVRTNGNGVYVTLVPRQPVRPMPYALTAAGLSGTLPATQISGTLPASVLPSGTVTNNASAVNLNGTFSGSGSGLTNLAAQSVSLTNLTLDNSLRIACANIDAYGINRFGWPRTLARLATNGPLFVAIVGNGWVEDSEFAGFVTNLLSYRPLAGYASEVLYYLPTTMAYGPFSGADTALRMTGDDTNWHGTYFVLTNTGSISAPAQTVVSDVCGAHYLANPNGGSFVLEIRTNGAAPYIITNLDTTWVPVATASALSPGWEGRTVWWTNVAPGRTQLRVRATSSGSTPIVGYAQWDSTVTNGVVLAQYSHQSSGNWYSYTDPNKVFPIWRAWRPDLILLTGGFDDSRAADFMGQLAVVQTGFAGADVVDVGGHLSVPGYNCSVEQRFCLLNGIPFFDGQAASAATWGSFNNGLALGLYQDTAHLTSNGYATFSQLFWSWMALTRVSPAAQLAGFSGLTTNIVLTPSNMPTLCYSNGLLIRVQ